MEVLGRRSAVADLDIAFGAQLQEALNASAGVFRALAFETVGQQQDETAGLVPFRLGGDDELVDDDLAAVDEVAELRFPNDQRQRIRYAVAKLKAHHGVFAEQAIDHFE